MRDAIAVGGVITHVSPSIFQVSGLTHLAALGDRVALADAPGVQGEIIQIDENGAIVKPYQTDAPLVVGAQVYRLGAKTLAPCAAWKGRVIDALGAPVDGGGPLPRGPIEMPIERSPPPALRRSRVMEPMTTGVRAIDLFTPICVGQRIGIFAGSGVGKSTLLAMLANAKGFDAIVIGLIGERGREVREFLEGPIADRLQDTVTVVATGDESALMRQQAARSAMTIAEWFRDAGAAVLLIVDSVTRFAQASREIAISAGEPPVARGFPPRVFSDLPQLLERAGPGEEGKGGITALFSVLVDGDDHNDPIADAIRGTLDGHIVLDRAIAAQGRYPAIDILTSLSRLSHLAWTPQQKKLAHKLRSMAARFEETRDLRAMGGYQAGVDPELDSCVTHVPKLYAALRQDPSDPPSVDVFAEVAEALRGPATPK